MKKKTQPNKVTIIISKQDNIAVSVSLKDSNIIYTTSGQLFQNNKLTVAGASHSPCIGVFFPRNIYRFLEGALCKNSF